MNIKYKEIRLVGQLLVEGGHASRGYMDKMLAIFTSRMES
jgi:mannitol/fructose-specific phosphotransferase system IIA component